MTRVTPLPEAEVSAAGPRRRPFLRLLQSFQAAKRVSRSNSTERAAAASTPARRPVEPVSAEMEHKASPLLAPRSAPRLVSPRLASLRPASSPAVPPVPAPGSPPAWRGPARVPGSGISTRARPPRRGVVSAARCGEGRPRRALPGCRATPPSNGFRGVGNEGRRPGLGEPRPGWGECARRCRARPTCPPERAPGHGCVQVCMCVCVCAGVCAHTPPGLE